MVTFKSLKQFSLESNRPQIKDATIVVMHTFNRSKIETSDWFHYIDIILIKSTD